MHHLRKMLTAVAVLGAVVALAACGGSSSSGSSSGSTSSTSGGSSSTPTQKVTLLMNWFPQAEQGGYFQAEAAGLGEKDGISLHVLSGGPQVQTIPQVAAGKADFGVATSDELVLARSQGVPIVQVFGGMDKFLQCMMYQPSSGIKNFPDLSGHQIAVSPSSDFWLWLKGKFNLQNIHEVNNSGSLAEFKHNTGLVQQCFTTSEPYIASQQNIPHAELLVADAGYNPYSQGLFTSEKMLKEHPDTVRKVVAAVQQGWQQFLQDPAKGRALVLKENANMDGGLFDFAAKTLKDGGYFADPIGNMTTERWTTLIKQLKDAGVLKKDVDPSTVFTNQFITQ